jgi:hypothetical protein
MRELRIAIPDHDRALQALRDTDALTRRLAGHGALPVWVSYGDGHRTIDLLAAGDLHVAATGPVPPLRARSEGVDVVYVAACDPITVRAQMLVRAGSTIEGLGVLRGHRIALERGSAPTIALAELLERAGSVTYRDLDIELLPTELARRALIDGHVDAWFDHTGQFGPALQPLPDAAIQTTDQTVWFARRDTPAPLVEALLSVIALDPCAAEPITRTFLAEQQRRADLLAAQGAICLPVDLGAWTPLAST